MSASADLDRELAIGWSGIEARAGAVGKESFEMALTRGSLREEFDRLLMCSRFFAEQAAREFDWLLASLNDDTLLSGRDWTDDDWLNAVQDAVADAGDEAQYMTSLRRFRQRQMLRLVWRDFSRRAALETTLSDASALADACIRSAVEFAAGLLAPRWGQPVGADSGEPQSLVVLAMGKLGARELNLSSDIDLIFAYPESGSTAGGRVSTSNQEYFIRLGQTVIRLLDAITVDGFVFRVDMRLRPYGDSGALVGSYDALELYYQQHGRDWERYAMIKARPVTGGRKAVRPLEDMLSSFVYRRYTDFSVVESLRDMKAMISAETRRLNLANDIKRGAGGIREIEFIVQSLQLIHGGRLTELRQRGLQLAIDQLVSAELLPLTAASQLRSAYRFLRNLEHALQGMADQQTQRLPDDALSQQKLAMIMGCDDWHQLSTLLGEHRDAVSSQFARLVAPAALSGTVGDDISFASLDSAALARMGFADPDSGWQAVQSLLDSSRLRAMDSAGRQRLERFLPRLIETAANTAFPDHALTRSLPFVAAVCRRSAYLVLLEENPQALAALVQLNGRSVWVAEKLASRPELVDELLHPGRWHSAPSREEMRALVQQQLLRVPPEDLEEQMVALGRIKDAVVLRVAASELLAELPTMKVSDNLTYLAEVMIEQAIHVARSELVRRHGEPVSGRAGFAVMGYGKLGGIELSYGSDLDLVFVYDSDNGQTAGPRVIDNVRFYTRLAQRVVHVLSTTMLAGRLYDVDLRLRPSGESGLVATSLAALRRYQLESAWTWEHQALVRARPIAGDVALLTALTELRADVLGQPRDAALLANDVVTMRGRMLDQGQGRLAVDAHEFDVKHGPGGIVDIEFVVQYLVLVNAATHPEIIRWSDVVRIVDALAEASLLGAADASALVAAYLDYRSAVHLAVLAGQPPVVAADMYVAHRLAVQRIRDKYLPGLPTWQVPEN